MPSPARSLLLLPAAAAALLLAGCALDDGPRTTETRDVSRFTRVDNRGSVDVHLHVGRRQHVRVSAGEKVLDDIRTTVRGGTLRVEFDHHSSGPDFGTDGPVVDATVPHLAGVTASGSGDIEADGIDADALDVRSDGSADLDLNGTARRLALALDGSGDGHLAGLAARDARVTVGGSGDAEVSADRRLDVAIDGSGDVHYRGHPALTRRVDGSGDLEPAG